MFGSFVPSSAGLKCSSGIFFVIFLEICFEETIFF